MFGLFKKKSPEQALQDRYRKLLEEAHKLSNVNRQQSDAKQAEAEAVLAELEQLRKSA